MRSFDLDVPKTITSVLSTHNWRDRKRLIDKVSRADSIWHV